MPTFENCDFPSGTQHDQSSSPVSQTSYYSGSGSASSRSGSAGAYNGLRRSRSGSARSRCSSHRSRSGSVRSRSGSYDSRAGSARSRSGSVQTCSEGHRSRSGSVRSRSGSYDSRAGSARSRSGSVQSCSEGHRSRSGSVRSRRGSYDSRAGSARSRSGSVQSCSEGHRSRSGSVRSRSGSYDSRTGSGSVRSDCGSACSRSGSVRSDSGSACSRSSSLRSRNGSVLSCNGGNGSRSGSRRSRSRSRCRHSGSIRSGGSRSGLDSDSENSYRGLRHSRIKYGQDVGLEKTQAAWKCSQIIDTDKNGYDSDDDTKKSNFMSDFDMMMLRKKSERLQRRKHDIDFINDNDDLIDQLIVSMKIAAKEDRQLNIDRKPATKKLSILKHVMSQLIKKKLQLAFLEHNILSVLTDWLAPLPNRSLPCLQIRESILKLLEDFPKLDTNHLKLSGIGKAVMYLYKHPQETKANRDRAEQLIYEWSRPVFDVSRDFSAMSKEERLERDVAQLARYQRKISEPTPSNKAQPSDEDKVIYPGAPGWIPRARVPMPSNTNYVIRPKSTADITKTIEKKRKPTRLDCCLKRFCKLKRENQPQNAGKLSIEGRKMPL